MNIHYRTPVTQLQRDPSSSFSLHTEAIRRQREQVSAGLILLPLLLGISDENISSNSTTNNTTYNTTDTIRIDDTLTVIPTGERFVREKFVREKLQGKVVSKCNQN